VKSVLRCEVSEVGQPALPAIDVAGGVVIGSGANAQIRLPAKAAQSAVVRIQDGTWTALADVSVDGATKREGDTGAIADGTTFESGGYTVRVGPAPDGVPPSPPQRTESLARELVRGMLGGASPMLIVERGPSSGAKRNVPPPDVTMVIGRGDEATWTIVDEDLSRTHAELRRGWDGTVLRDLGSKNGTRVDGVRVRESIVLHDGALIELGNIALRYEDPAERHLRAPSVVTSPPRAANSTAFVLALVIAVIAIAGLVWILN
jgi:predicted component of type VI protein secretion system